MLLYYFFFAIESANLTRSIQIPDLNLSPPVENDDHLETEKYQNQSTPKTRMNLKGFRNKNFQNSELKVELISPSSSFHITGLIPSKQKSIRVKGGRFYSELQRKHWRDHKQAIRSALSDESKKALYKKQYRQRKEKEKTLVSTKSTKKNI